jgi:U4/U6.U5 tri-snRNP component SNU23
MSTNLNYKQVANVTRRTWDKETYEKKAQDRLRADDQPGGASASVAAASSSSTTILEEFLPAPKDAVGPEGSDRAYLKARSSHADIDSKIGTAELIAGPTAAVVKSSTASALKDGGVTKTGVGWHCRVCDCFLKDSHTYLDHINGRKHQLKLGYSMRVERSTKDQLQDKLKQLAATKLRVTAASDDDDLKNDNKEEDHHAIVQTKDEERRQRKEEREQRRREKKRRQEEESKALQPENDDDEDDDEPTEVAIDPDMAAMMGFAGFGGGNKN